MRIAILSDLHLCSDPRICEFTHDADAFMALLERIERDHEHVLVVGDVYNLDHGWLPVARGLELRAARRAFPHLTARLHDDPRYLMVCGNHDAALVRLMGVPEVRRLELGGRRLLMLHGHQFDGPVKRLPAISPTGSWLAGWLRRYGVDGLADRLVDLGMIANRLEHDLVARFRGHVAAPTTAPPERPEPLRRDVAAARELLDQTDVDIVVMGHTHRAVQHRFDDGRLYLNAGACAFGDLQWTSVDLEDLTWTHHAGTPW